MMDHTLPTPHSAAEAEAREQMLYRLQAELCQTLADPTRLRLLGLLEGGPRTVTALVQATGQRQAKISQHLAVLRQHGLVRSEREGAHMLYALTDAHILEACRITRELLLRQLAQRGQLADLLIVPRASAG